MRDEEEIKKRIAIEVDVFNKHANIYNNRNYRYTELEMRKAGVLSWVNALKWVIDNACDKCGEYPTDYHDGLRSIKND